MNIPAHDYPPIEPDDIREGDLILWVLQYDEDQFSVKQFKAEHDGHAWLSVGQHYLVQRWATGTVSVPKPLFDNLREQVEINVDELGFTPLWLAAQKVVDNGTVE